MRGTIECDDGSRHPVVVGPRGSATLTIVFAGSARDGRGALATHARLAARLTGWRIDIKSESQAQQEAAKRASAPRSEEPAPAAVQAGGHDEAPAGEQ